MLHDVGKYISMNFIAESSYNIIMSNEIIGLPMRNGKPCPHRPV